MFFLLLFFITLKKILRNHRTEFSQSCYDILYKMPNGNFVYETWLVLQKNITKRSANVVISLFLLTLILKSDFYVTFLTDVKIEF